MQSSLSLLERYDLDHRVIFVAACSSFITLLILSIFNKCHYMKIDVKLSNRFVSETDDYHIDKKNVSCTEYDLDHDDDEHSDSKVESPIDPSLFTNMINKEMYIHEAADDYFETEAYLSRLPLTAASDPNWIRTPIQLLVDQPWSERLHQAMLDQFDPLQIEPSSNVYLPEITSAIHRFNRWRTWSDEWKYRATKDDMKVWTHALPDCQLEIVKCEKIISLPVHIIVGTLMNVKHIFKMDPVMKSMNILQKSSLSSTVLHLCCKCPFPLTDRDFVNVAMFYIFKDGSILLGNTSCENDELLSRTKAKNGKYVRATITLTMYHIRPHFDGDINHTKVTFYSHVLMNGSIPQWLLNLAYMELAGTLTKMEKYVKENLKDLHKPGELHIIPNPYLKMMSL